MAMLAGTESMQCGSRLMLKPLPSAVCSHTTTFQPQHTKEAACWVFLGLCLLSTSDQSEFPPYHCKTVFLWGKNQSFVLWASRTLGLCSNFIYWQHTFRETRPSPPRSTGNSWNWQAILCPYSACQRTHAWYAVRMLNKYARLKTKKKKSRNWNKWKWKYIIWDNKKLD